MQTATVRFVPSASPSIVGYRLAIATSSGQYNSGTEIDFPVGSARVTSGGVLEFDVTMSANADHYLALRAYSTQALSGFSNEIVIPAVAAAASSSTAATGSASVTSVSSSGTSSSGSSASLGTTTSGTTASSGGSSTTTATDPNATTDPTSMTSLDLDGAGEYLASSAAYPLGVTNQFTLSIWALEDPQATGRRALISIRGGSQAAQNRVELTSDGVGLEMTVYNDAGQLVYDASYSAVLVPGAWQNIALTFDSQVDSAPILLVDGQVQVPTSANLTGSPATFADSAGRVFVGASGSASNGTWWGAIGHVAIWSVALGDDEIGEISLRGHSLDLRANLGAYQGKDMLLHYWRLGADPSAVGTDYGPATIPIELDDPAGNVDASDIIPDAPVLLP